MFFICPWIGKTDIFYAIKATEAKGTTTTIRIQIGLAPRGRWSAIRQELFTTATRTRASASSRRWCVKNQIHRVNWNRCYCQLSSFIFECVLNGLSSEFWGNSRSLVLDLRTIFGHREQNTTWAEKSPARHMNCVPSSKSILLHRGFVSNFYDILSIGSRV